MNMKKCPKCSKELPNEAQFCPYCMTKFETDKIIIPKGKKKISKKLIALIVAGVVIAASIFGFAKWGYPAIKNASNQTGVNDPNQTGVNVDGSVISWANMKIDNPDLKLTEDQIEVLKYFDDDYFPINKYDNLKKYPKAYRNTQISFYGQVVKVINATDEEYECLFLVCDYESSGKDNYVIIKGKQDEKSRMVEATDEFGGLACYGRYIDIQSYEVDGVSRQLPVVTINYTNEIGTLNSGDVSLRFGLDTISKVAKAILGDVKISEPVDDENFGVLIATPNKQTNSAFTAFEFSMFKGYIKDVNSSETEIRQFGVAADFNHYIVSVYNENLKNMYLEYYDRDFNKLWGREFFNIDIQVYDYTSEYIYFVEDNDLHIIDIKTGEDTCDPILVGQKVKVNVTKDGIILIGKGTKDNIMKTDLNGKVLWKTSVDIDVTECGVLQIIDGNIVVNLISCLIDGYSSEYKSKMAVIEKDGNLFLEFTDADNSSEDDYF